MNRLLLLGATAFLAGPAKAESITDKVHNTCKDTKDYMGCVIMQVNGVQKTANTAEECWKGTNTDTRFCIAGEGSDGFGLPKKEGWIYATTDGGTIVYTEWNGKDRTASGRPIPMPYQVPHKGEVRYIAFRSFLRTYSEPTAGTPGYTNTIGTAQTNCYGYGASMNCTTTPATKIFVPGVPATAGGVKTVPYVSVFDCQEDTEATYRNGKLQGNWKKSNKKSTFCKNISDYPELDFKL